MPDVATRDSATHSDNLMDLTCASRAVETLHGLHKASQGGAPTRKLSSASCSATSTAEGA